MRYTRLRLSEQQIGQAMPMPIEHAHVSALLVNVNARHPFPSPKLPSIEQERVRAAEPTPKWHRLLLMAMPAMSANACRGTPRASHGHPIVSPGEAFVRHWCSASQLPTNCQARLIGTSGA